MLKSKNRNAGWRAFPAGLRPVLALALVLAMAAACAEDAGQEAGSEEEEASEPQEEAAVEEQPDTAEEQEDEEPEPVDDDAMAELADFYSGETIEYIVPGSPGGGATIYAEINGQWFSELLPGNPTIQTVFVPGAGGQLALGEWALRRERDGTHVMISSGTATIPQILDDPDNPTLDYDPDVFVPIMVHAASAVLYASPSTGVEEPADLTDADEPLVIGEFGVDGSGLLFIIAWEMLGIDVETVVGYEGRADTRIAFERGETNLDFQTVGPYRQDVEPLVEAGEAIPLFTPGYIEDGEVVRGPVFPDLPTVKEVYEELHGEEPSGIAWEAYKTLLAGPWGLTLGTYLHVDDPPEVKEAWLNAAEEMASDPEYIEEYTEAFFFEPLVGDDANAQREAAFDIDPEVRDWINDLLVEKFDYERS